MIDKKPLQKGQTHRAMISQPMNGFTSKEIEKTRADAVNTLTKWGYEVVDTVYNSLKLKDEKLPEDIKLKLNSMYGTEPAIKNIPLFYLSMVIQKMSECDTIWFCKGWEKERECVIQHNIAKAYGLKILGYSFL